MIIFIISDGWIPLTKDQGLYSIKRMDVLPQDPAELRKPQDGDVDFFNRSEI